MEEEVNQTQKIGVLLRQKRLEKNISIETVTHDLKLRPRLIVALEESDYKNLADATSVGALVKSYARYLGLNADEMAAGYRSEIESIRKKVEIDFPEMLTSDFKLSKVAILLAVFVIGGFFVWNFFKHSITSGSEVTLAQFNEIVELEKAGKGSSAETKDISKNEQTQSSETNDTKLANVFEITAPPIEMFEVVRTPKVSVKAARGDSWVEIRNAKRKIVFSGVLRKGQDYTLPEAEGGYVMKTGNAAALDVYHNEENQNLFTDKMHVVKDVKL